MKKIFLTSAITMCMIAPAIAEPSHTSATFPNDELMQEDYTYTGQATYTNTGVYSGNVDADPEFAWTDINVTAGNYLPQNATATTGCTAGNFCPGLQNAVHYDAENDQGITSCSTLGDNSYTLSVANATSETDCYKACATSMVSHATTVTGNDYYGAGTDTCTATACENGWSVSSGACVANTININWNGASAEDIAANEAGQCTYGGDIRTPVAFSGTVPTGKHFVGWKFVKTPAAAPATFDLSTLDASIDGTAGGYQNDRTGDLLNTTDYGLTEDQTWGITFSYGKVRGEARCSNVDGTDYTADPGSAPTYTVGDPGSATTGGNCWCRATGYQASGSDTWQNVSSNPWVFRVGGPYSIADNCAILCTDYCANSVLEESRLRVAVFGQSGN